MGSYNPNFPTVLGNEFSPTTVDPATIDTGTAFGYTFPSQEWEGIEIARVLMTAPPPGNPLRKVIVQEIYTAASAPATGPMRKIIVPVTSGASVLNATLADAATFQAALNNPTDAGRVNLTGPLAGARMWFDTSSTNTQLRAALINGRVVDVSVRYAMTGEFFDHVTPVTMALERVSAGVVFDMDTTISGEETQYLNVVPRRSRLGDYNPFWNTTINPNTDYRRAPWMGLNGSNNHTGLEAMQDGSGTNIALRFTTASTVAVGDLAFAIHYVALEVTYCQEGRQAAGGLDLSGGVSLTSGLFHADIPVFDLNSYGFPWDSSAGREYAITVGQGYVGARSVAYPVPVEVDRVVPARDTFRGHRGIILNKTIREGEEWTAETTDAIPAVVLYDSTSVFDPTTIYPPSQVYVAPFAVDVSSSWGAGTVYQWIDDQAVVGDTYTHVRFYARRSTGTTDYLEVFLTTVVGDVPVGPGARITVEEFDLLPEIADGWKEITLALSPVYVTTGSGIRKWAFGSSSSSNFSWQVLGAEANPYEEATDSYDHATYGGVTEFARIANVNDFNADYSLMLIRALDVPADLAVVTAVQALTLLDESCGVPVEAMPTGIRYHQLSWSAVNDMAVAGFLYYEVQRRDTTMDADVWETVGEITNVASLDMDDYEARVGVVSSYRIRQVHEDGYTSLWSSTVTSTIIAPGVTGTGVDVGVLILTSNHNPAGNLAYVSTWAGSSLPTQDFSYPEGGQTTYQPMFNRDYQVAFRPLERAGVEFTRTLLINAVGVPTLTADKALVALRDLAWDTVPYVCTRDEANNRWLTALEVPSSATRDVPSSGHLVLAPVTFTEVTATPAPVDVSGPCEGLRLEGLDTYQYWTVLDPAYLAGTRVETDTFTRVTANGWGSADTGQAWTVGGGGAAADFLTTGAVGQIVSATVTVDRRLTAAGTHDYHRSKVSFTVPAVATGGVFHAGLITRYQDASNFYYYKIEFATAGTFKLDVVRVLAGVVSTIRTGAAITTYTVGTVIHLEEMTRGTSLTARVWKDAADPPSWATGSPTGAVAHLTAQTSMAETGLVGVTQTRAAANTNVNLTLSYDNFTVDTLPKVFDIRAHVRVFGDQFYVQYGVDEFANDTDSEGAWYLTLFDGGLTWYIYGNNFTILTTTNLVGMGLVKNRDTWVRAVLTQDDGTGGQSVDWYRSDDGLAWTLVETTTVATPTQPIPPLMTGGLLTVLNSPPGGIWTKYLEIRLDGAAEASPDFEAEPVDTIAFTDATGNDWETTSGRGICATLE